MPKDDRLRLPLPDKATFACYSEEAKLNTLFDLLVVALVNQQDMYSTLVRTRRIDLSIAGIMGLVGGAAAYTAERLTKLFT